MSHTGQLFFDQTTYDPIAALSPYVNDTVTRTLNAADRVWTTVGGSSQVLALMGGRTTHAVRTQFMATGLGTTEGEDGAQRYGVGAV